jgi:hypothetical protein
VPQGRETVGAIHARLGFHRQDDTALRVSQGVELAHLELHLVTGPAMECDQLAGGPELDQVLEVEGDVQVAAVAIGREQRVPTSTGFRPAPVDPDATRLVDLE